MKKILTIILVMLISVGVMAGCAQKQSEPEQNDPPAVYTITYHLDGGSNSSENPIDFSSEHDNIMLKAPTKSRYVFDGWYFDSSMSGNQVTILDTSIAHNVDLYAKWIKLGIDRHDGFDLDMSQDLPVLSMSVSGDTSVVDLADKITISGANEWGLYKDKEGTDKIEDKKILLEKEGVHTNYIIISSEDGEQNIVYEVRIKKLGKRTASFIIDGNVSTQELEQGSKVAVIPASPQKKGYIFSGWTIEGSSEVIDFDKFLLEEDTTFVPSWQLQSYDITYHFDNAGNNISNPSNYTVEDNITFEAPTRAGYTFLGWYTTKDYAEGSEITEIVKGSTGDKDLYAKWVANENILHFDGNGATSGTMNDMKISTDESANLSANTFAKEGYTFSGWATSKNGAKVYEDNAEYKMGANTSYTLYAVWSVLEYSINYELNQGVNDTSNPSSYTVEDNITLQAPTRAGYTFLGWYTTQDFAEGSEISEIANGSTGDKDLYAKWVANENILHFDGNGATSGTMNDMKISTDESANLSANTFAREGYTFVGWTTSKNGAKVYEDQAQYKMGTEASYTLYAVWSVVEYSINYELNQGVNDISNPSSYTVEDNITFEAPTRAGYTFLGWYTTKDYAEGSEITEIVKGSTGDKDLYAKWVANENILHFDGNGATSGTMNDMKISTDESAKLSANTFAREGYTFVGWTTSKNGEKAYEDNAEYKMGTEGSYTLYAVWDIVTYHITYKANAHITNRDTFTIKDLPIKLNTQDNKYYTDSWYIESPGAEDIPVDKISEIGDITLHAYFERWTLGVKYVQYGNEYHVEGYTGSDEEVFILSQYKGKTVSAIDDKAFKRNKTITNVGIGNGVRSIGAYAFFGCSKLNEIYIGHQVQTIGDYAFSGCSLLAQVEIGDNVESIGSSAFEDCTNLNEVVFGDKVESIGNGAFGDCTNLNEVVLGDNVKTIGAYAFSGSGISKVSIGSGVTDIFDGAFYVCKSLQEVHISDLAAWCEINFENGYANPLFYAHNLYLNNNLVTDLVIPNWVSTISKIAFYECTSIKTLTIPDGVSTISRYAFGDCSGLTSVTIADTVTNIDIDQNAFNGSYNITSVNIPVSAIGYVGGSATTTVIINSGEEIKNSAFSQYKKMTSISIPNTIKSIGSGAFARCNNLQRVNITDLEAWCNINFVDNPLSYAHHLYLNDQLVTEVVVPDSVQSLGSAFEKCDDLTSITIPATTEIIGDPIYGCTNIVRATVPTTALKYVGKSCKSIQEVVINGGDTITDSAFRFCETLTKVTIPSSVTTIGQLAFDNCQALREVYIDDLASWCNVEFGQYGNPLINAQKLYVNNKLVTELVIPNGVTSISDGAFTGFVGITSVIVPPSVTSIGAHAFDGCKQLIRVNIPDNVITMGYNVFNNSSSLVINVEVSEKPSGWDGWWSGNIKNINWGKAM